MAILTFEQWNEFRAWADDPSDEKDMLDTLDSLKGQLAEAHEFALSIAAALGYRTDQLENEEFPSTQIILETIGQLEEMKAQIAEAQATLPCGHLKARWQPPRPERPISVLEPVESASKVCVLDGFCLDCAREQAACAAVLERAAAVCDDQVEKHWQALKGTYERDIRADLIAARNMAQGLAQVIRTILPTASGLHPPAAPQPVKQTIGEAAEKLRSALEASTLVLKEWAEWIRALDPSAAKTIEETHPREDLVSESTVAGGMVKIGGLRIAAPGFPEGQKVQVVVRERREQPLR